MGVAVRESPAVPVRVIRNVRARGGGLAWRQPVPRMGYGPYGSIVNTSAFTIVLGFTRRIELIGRRGT